MTSSDSLLPEDTLLTIASGIVSPAAARLYVAVVFEREPGGGQDADAARELIENHLVGVTPGGGVLFAYPPRMALARASVNRVRGWMAAAESAERAMDSLEQLASAVGDGSVTVSPEVDASDDRERTLDSIIVSATKEICLAQDWHDDPEFVGTDWSAVAPEAVDTPKLPHRYIYDHRLFSVPWFGDAVEQEIAAGIDVRVTHVAIPSFLLVVDAKIAAYSPAAGQPGRVTTDQGLVGLLALAFEQLWTRAVAVDASGEMTSAQRSVLTLLGLGYSNRMISQALGVHERTVRRRVGELLDHFGETQRGALVAHSVRLDT